MNNNDFVDELNNYLRKRDKDNFLKRYSELMENVTPNSDEFIDLKLVRITYEFLFVGDFEKLYAEMNLLEPVVFANASDIKKIKFLINKGIVLGRLKKFTDAIDVYSHALEYCTSDDMVVYRVDILTNMGVIYFRNDNRNKALKCYLAAYDLNKKSQCQAKLTSLLVNIGVIYLNLEEYDKAIYYFELCLKTIPDSREYAKLVIYFNLIITNSFIGDFESASKIIDFIKSGNIDYSHSDEISFHKALAIYYSNKKEHYQSIEEYRLILANLKGDNIERERLVCYNEIGKQYLEMKEYEQCGKIIEKVDSDENLAEFSSGNIDYLSIKVAYYSYLQDFERALEYSQKNNKLQLIDHKSLEKQFNEDLTIPIATQRSNISFDAYDWKISELEQTNKELLEKEKLLIESLNELKAESNLREKLISIISHDVRAPLGNIVQLLEMFDDFQDEAERTEILVEVIHGMKQTFSLTNELVNWAKELINVKQSKLFFLNVREIVADVEMLYKQQLDTKRIVIVNNLSEDKLIFSHKTSIKSCFRNIIQNAIKYSEPYSKIEINQNITAESVTYSIRDYGKGVPAEKLKDLFNISNISTLGTNQESGIGIGLLLVKELVDKNNGHIRCESEVGVGTTFYLTFPINPNDRLT